MSSLDVERLERLLTTPALAGSPAAARLLAEIDRADIRKPAEMP
ncbi:MAG: nucleoside diphosphate kinase regulator, partial [Gammaproteobacteria bacterium]